MRKPWVFLRLRLFGWKVFFMGVPSVVLPRPCGAGRKYTGRSRRDLAAPPQKDPSEGLPQVFVKKVAKNPLAHGCARRAGAIIRRASGSLPRAGSLPRELAGVSTTVERACGQ